MVLCEVENRSSPSGKETTRVKMAIILYVGPSAVFVAV